MRLRLPVLAPASLSPLAARVILAGMLAAAVTVAGAAPARAETADEAAAQVAALSGQVQALQTQAAGALAAYRQALSGVDQAVTASVQAERASAASARAAAAARTTLDDRVRALYMAGGPAGLMSSLLGAGGLSDLTSRVATVQSVIDDSRAQAARQQQTAAAGQATAQAAQERAYGQIATVRDVAAAAARVSDLLAREQRLLAAARQHAASLRAAEAAAAALAAQQAQVAAITAGAGAQAQVLPASPGYLALYHAAATTCPGLSWAVLAAIGQVESGHGRNPGVSSAGAMGPMQFLPSTFAAYGVAVGHRGPADIMNPADAIYSAARYLCANGAGTGPAGLRSAIFAYNHADRYVQLVLGLAARYAAGS